MKLLIIYLLLIFGLQEPTFIKGKGFRGYIFDADTEVNIYYKEKPKRFTPTTNEIISCEKIISKQLVQLNTGKSFQDGDCPVIHKNLSRYIRQYVGFIDKDGVKVIWINMIWEKSSFIENVSKDIMNVADGCSYYWNIKVNLKTQKPFELYVNTYGG